MVEFIIMSLSLGKMLHSRSEEFINLGFKMLHFRSEEFIDLGFKMLHFKFIKSEEFVNVSVY